MQTLGTLLLKAKYLEIDLIQMYFELKIKLHLSHN